MTEFLFGAIGAILVLASFAAGFGSACYVCKKFKLEPPVDDERTPEEKERQEKEIDAQNRAFEELMGYNLNVAYGLDGSQKNKDGEID